MRSILVVANQTLGGEALLQRMREAAWFGPCRFHVLVPATAVPHQLSWNEGEALAFAQQRLAEGLARFDAEGFEVTGEVGDASPFLAIADAMRHDHYDEIMVSTLPLGVSRWLKMDLPARVRRRHNVPVTHVIAAEAAQPA
jgi:hypothetical protein